MHARLLPSSYDDPERGVGRLYELLSRANHSCNPNTVKIQKGKKTFIVASELIQKGAEIFDNYGSLFYTAEKSQRNIDLGFDCKCQACEENWQKYRFLSDKINDPIGDSVSNVGEATRRQLEKGRAANSLMQKMNLTFKMGRDIHMVTPIISLIRKNFTHSN